ncbi:MAG: insulinase family protein, partial [Bacteroidales bacterium]|nr:insulinase family protein [Bacteroidales bacterium]
EVNAFVTGDIDPGLLIVTGKITPGVDSDKAHVALEQEITRLSAKPPSAHELRKVKNKAIATNTFGELSLLNKAMSLAYYAHLGTPEVINKIPELYEAVKPQAIFEHAKTVLRPENCSTLFYLSEKN